MFVAIMEIQTGLAVEELQVYAWLLGKILYNSYWDDGEPCKCTDIQLDFSQGKCTKTKECQIIGVTFLLEVNH